MTADVVDIGGRSPHWSGEAVCLECGHGWVAVAPLGTVQIECPVCRTDKGVPKYPFRPELAWECACGCELFNISPSGAQCYRCGVTANWGAE